MTVTGSGSATAGSRSSPTGIDQAVRQLAGIAFDRWDELLDRAGCEGLGDETADAGIVG
jgi:hypothetical protein